MRLGHKNRVGAEVRSRAQSDGGKASKRVCILVYPAPETSIRENIHAGDPSRDPKRSHDPRLKRSKLELFS